MTDKTQGTWSIRLTDGSVMTLQHGRAESNPLDLYRDDFFEGDNLVLDAGGDDTLFERFPVFEEDDSFCLIPLSLIEGVFFTPYGEHNGYPEPVKIS